MNEKVLLYYIPVLGYAMLCVVLLLRFIYKKIKDKLEN